MSVLVVGEALIDLIVSPDGRITAVPGGGPFNVARTIARLGVRVGDRVAIQRAGDVIPQVLENLIINAMDAISEAEVKAREISVTTSLSGTSAP